MHHKSYFEKCLLSALIVQENPKAFKEFLATQNLKSFPTLMPSIGNLTPPESVQHADFDIMLKKQALLCKFKLDQDSDDMFSRMEESDHEWILSDKQVLFLFNPMKHDALSKLLIQVFSTLHSNLKDNMEPFVNKTVEVVAELFSEGMLLSLIFFKCLPKLLKSDHFNTSNSSIQYAHSAHNDERAEFQSKSSLRLRV